MTRNGPVDRIIRAATRIEPGEQKAVLLSFLFVFLLMAAYFILRPVRNAMASNWDDTGLSLLWTGTFVFSLLAVTVYGGIIPRVRFRWLVPGVYVFFTLSFFAFYAAATQIENREWLNAAFYIWVSVFSLFHVSVFWSFMADIYNRHQAPRLFAFIAAGSSLGAITGPALTIGLAEIFGTYEMLLVAAVMLLLPLPIIGVLNRLKVTELGNADLQADLRRQVMSRNPFRGFTLFFSDSFLFGIGLFIFLYVSMGAFVYFLLADLMRPFAEATRSQMWALIDLTVNTLSVVTALFVTGRIAMRLGMAKTLALVPAGIAAGFVIVAAAPILAVVIGLEIARRAGNYAITRPGREMLFTIVDRDRRFRAKPVIDIVIYRGGDAVWAWAFTGLTTGLGLGSKAVAAVGACIALAWTAVAAFLGRRYDRAESETAPDAGERTLHDAKRVDL